MLFVGDVVGPRAVAWLAERLPSLRAEHAVDLAIVDAENSAADGASMSLTAVERLLAAGADVVSGGNHAFDGGEYEAVLGHERVLRPLNVADGVPGRGMIELEVAGEPVRVVVLADRLALEDAPAFAHMALAPHAAFERLPPFAGTAIVEMHALSVAAKQSLAHALDGRVAAVLGTHTHEPTIELHLLAGGTALVSEVGMTGPRGGVQGMDPQAFAAWARGADPAGLSARPGDGEIVLGAVLLELEHGRTRAIRRV